MATTDERLAAHDATLVQMNERLGNIEASLRAMNGRFDSLQTQLATKADRDFVLKLTGWPIRLDRVPDRRRGRLTYR